MVKWVGLLMKLIDVLKKESLTYRYDFNTEEEMHEDGPLYA